MGKEVESLEDHPDLGALAADLAIGQLVDLVAALPVADQLAVDRQPAGVDLLEMVDAAKEGALAGAGRPDDAQHLSGRDLEVDAAEHLEAAEALVDSLGQNHRRRHQHPVIVVRR